MARTEALGTIRIFGDVDWDAEPVDDLPDQIMVTSHDGVAAFFGTPDDLLTMTANIADAVVAYGEKEKGKV